MVDRQGRLRIVGVAVLAVAVMGGVVASALVARAKGASDEGGASGDGDRSARDLRSFGSTAPDKKHELPSGCEPNPEKPGTVRFDLADNVLDLGTVRQGVQIQREVTLRNVGSGELCADEPVTGCGCVQAVLL